jgi:hypothetical protein
VGGDFPGGQAFASVSRGTWMSTGADLREHRLRSSAVAEVPAVAARYLKFFVAEMLIHPRFRELVEQPVRSDQLPTFGFGLAISCCANSG